MRFIKYFLFAAVLLVSVAVITNAASNTQIRIFFDGEQIKSDVAPEIVNERTMVPLRVISEGFDAEVTWDGTNQTVTVKKLDLTNTLKIGQETAYYLSDTGGVSIRLDAPPYIKNNRTMVPLRYLAESLGLDVGWNADERAVLITTVKPLPTPASLRFHKFREMGRFSGGLASVIDDNDKLGYIDMEGNIIIDYQFDTDINHTDYSKPDFIPKAYHYEDYLIADHLSLGCYAFSKDGYAYVKKNGEYFYIDKTGKKIDNTFSGKYYSAGPFVNGRAAAQKTKGGLFGYINEKGDPVTEFKYLSASNFKDGAAKGVLVVPASSVELQRKDNWQIVFGKDYLLSPYPDFSSWPSYLGTEPEFDSDTALMDVYLDANSSIIHSKHHEPAESEAYFRSGVNFELAEISSGLLLKYKPSSEGHGQYRYDYLDGTPAIVFDSTYDEIRAFPMGDDGFAKILCSDNGTEVTKYINNKGEFLDTAELARQNPYLFQEIKTVYLDSHGKGMGYIEYRNGSQFLSERHYFDDGSPVPPDAFLSNIRRKCFITEIDGRILYDFTDNLKNIYTSHVPGYMEEQFDYFTVWNSAYPEKQPNTNIYYLIWWKGMRFSRERILGFWTIE